MKLLGLFFGSDFDFYGLLTAQSEGVIEGITLFTSCGTDPVAHKELVFAAEEKSDRQRLAVSKAINEAFSTPFDREDIEDLSHMLDNIMDFARRAASEMAALHIAPDEHLATMFGLLRDGVAQIGRGCAALRHGRGAAHDAALEAKTIEWKMQTAYEEAMNALFESGDLRYILSHREVYRLVQDVGTQVANLAEFLQRLIIKLV